MAGRPRSYDTRCIVTTNIEQDLYLFGKDELGIQASEALTLGYIGRIDSELTVRKNIAEPELDRYLQIRNRVFKSNILEIERSQEAADTISSITDELRKKQKPSPDTGLPDTDAWTGLSYEQQILTYTQYIFTKEERQYWISRYRAVTDEPKAIILDEYLKEFLFRMKNDPRELFTHLDTSAVKRVISTWAESQAGGPT